MVSAVVPDRLLELHARAWPLGEATVVLELAPVGESTRVTLSYDLTAGVGSMIPRVLQSVLLRPRSAEMLHRLSDIAERRQVARPKAPRLNRTAVDGYDPARGH
ncbi:hypothetical protein AB0J82_27265 [Asanoa sp. NPDC049518]|uniref:hypothetical protein n=1 Tax=unclassified Asanoa TaxID=2685164 RepID=UPI00341DDD29